MKNAHLAPKNYETPEQKLEIYFACVTPTISAIAHLITNLDINFESQMFTYTYCVG